MGYQLSSSLFFIFVVIFVIRQIYLGLRYRGKSETKTRFWHQDFQSMFSKSVPDTTRNKTPKE